MNYRKFVLYTKEIRCCFSVFLSHRYDTKVKIWLHSITSYEDTKRRQTSTRLRETQAGKCHRSVRLSFVSFQPLSLVRAAREFHTRRSRDGIRKSRQPPLKWGSVKSVLTACVGTHNLVNVSQKGLIDSIIYHC